MTLSHTTGFPSVSSTKRKFAALHVRIPYCSPALGMWDTNICSLLTTAMVRIFLMFTQVYGTWTWSGFHKLCLLLNMYYKVLLGITNFTKLIIKTFFLWISLNFWCQISSVFFLHQEMGNLEVFKVCEEMKLCHHSVSLRIKAGEMQSHVMCLSPTLKTIVLSAGERYSRIKII